MALQLSPQLRQRFQELKQRYPSLRSALIPMLLFAQDELGYISDGEITSFLSSQYRLPAGSSCRSGDRRGVRRSASRWTYGPRRRRP